MYVVFGAALWIGRSGGRRGSRILVSRLMSSRRAASKKSPVKLDVFDYGPIHLDLVRVRVMVGKRRVSLRPNELRLLACLLENVGKVMRREQALEAWGYDYTADIDTRSVDTTMRRLRVKLGEAGDLIHTVRGFGYSLCDPQDP